MTWFPNITMERYTYTDDQTGLYGEHIHKYEYAGEILADLQNENNSELAKQYGVEKQNLYKIYIDLNTELTNTDILVDENKNQYQIIGEIQEYTHYHNYKRVHLIHVRGDLLGS